MVDLTKFSLSADPEDPVNNVVTTGDIGRMAGLFVPSQPFYEWATPVNAEAEHAKELMKNPNTGPPLTEQERNRQTWKIPTYIYRALYEAVVMRGDKKFNPANAPPPRSSDAESTVSSMSSMPAPPRSSGKVQPAPAFKRPRPLLPQQQQVSQQEQPTESPAFLQFQHDTSASLRTISKDVSTLKEKLQYTMQVLLDIRDAIASSAEADDGPDAKSDASNDDVVANQSVLQSAESNNIHSAKKRKLVDE